MIILNIAVLGPVAHGKTVFVATFSELLRAIPNGPRGGWECELSPELAKQLRLLGIEEPTERTGSGHTIGTATEMAELKNKESGVVMRFFALPGELQDRSEPNVIKKLVEEFDFLILAINPFSLLTNEERVNFVYNLAAEKQVVAREWTTGLTLLNAVTACTGINSRLDPALKEAGQPLLPGHHHNVIDSKSAREIRVWVEKKCHASRTDRTYWPSYQQILNEFQRQNRGALLVFNFCDVFLSDLHSKPFSFLDDMLKRLQKLVKFEFSGVFTPIFVETVVHEKELKPAITLNDWSRSYAHQLISTILEVTRPQQTKKRAKLLEDWIREVRKRHRWKLLLSAPLIAWIIVYVYCLATGDPVPNSLWFTLIFIGIAWIVSFSIRLFPERQAYLR